MNVGRFVGGGSDELPWASSILVIVLGTLQGSKSFVFSSSSSIRGAIWMSTMELLTASIKGYLIVKLCSTFEI